MCLSPTNRTPHHHDQASRAHVEWRQFSIDLDNSDSCSVASSSSRCQSDYTQSQIAKAIKAETAPIRRIRLAHSGSSESDESAPSITQARSEQSIRKECKEQRCAVTEHLAEQVQVLRANAFSNRYKRLNQARNTKLMKMAMAHWQQTVRDQRCGDGANIVPSQSEAATTSQVMCTSNDEDEDFSAFKTPGGVRAFCSSTFSTSRCSETTIQMPKSAGGDHNERTTGDSQSVEPPFLDGNYFVKCIDSNVMVPIEEVNAIPTTKMLPECKWILWQDKPKSERANAFPQRHIHELLRIDSDCLDNLI